MPAAIISFRFRPRTKQPPLPPPPSDEDDSDLSSPEHHIDPRKSSDKLVRGHATAADVLDPVHGQRKADIVSLPKTTNPAAVPRSPPSGKPFPPSAPASADTHAASNNTSTHAIAACGITSNPNAPPSANSNSITHKKSTLIRRVTSKLHIAIPSSKSHPHLSVAASSPSSPSPLSPPALSRKQTQSRNQPRRRNSFLPPAAPTLPNGFVSREHREAALRERGLLPPRKDLSEQEREEDAKLPVVALPLRSNTAVNVGDACKSLAEKIREDWLALNRDTESDHDGSDSSLPAYSPDGANPSLDLSPGSASPAVPVLSTPLPSTDNATMDTVNVDSAKGPSNDHKALPAGQGSPVQAPIPTQSREQMSVPPQQASASVPPTTVPRPSFSSLPRLSTSLEVLPEEDPEGPFTPLPLVPPPAVHVAQAESQTVTRPGIVISTAVDTYRQDSPESPMKTMIEGLFDAACLSPLSCHGSGLLGVSVPNTTIEELEDQPRPSFASLPPPRRHTTDTCERSTPHSPTAMTSSYPSSFLLTTSSVSRTTSSFSRSRSTLGKVSSFADLRRSVSTSFRSISTTSHRSTARSQRSSAGTGADEAGVRIRTPVSPTMHNRASLLSEMHAIEDPESRRLCEMAFLD
ncbi:hypothetical protein V8B97DRAFT_329812 [Scleroderma yunnanense]